MAHRVSVLVFTVILAASSRAPGAQQAPAQTERPSEERVPAESVTAQEAPSEAEATAATVNVEEAIRLAIRTLDRIDAEEEGDDVQALLEEANGHIEDVRAADPGNPWLGYLYGRLLARIGRAGDAIEQLRDFVDTREGRNEWRAFCLLGDLFAGEFPRLAKANYEKAKALNPAAPDVLLGLSACEAKLGATEEAIQLARDAAAADGHRTVRYVSHLAALLKAARRPDEALLEAKRARELAQRDVEADPGALKPLVVADRQYQLLIEILQIRLARATVEQRDGTSRDTTRISADSISLASYLRQRAELRQTLALHEALRALELGVEGTAPNTPPALLEQHGITLAEVGRNDAAIEVFERLVASDPGNAVAMEWLARLKAPLPSGDRSEDP